MASEHEADGAVPAGCLVLSVFFSTILRASPNSRATSPLAPPLHMNCPPCPPTSHPRIQFHCYRRAKGEASGTWTRICRA
jgi:hypothetical protein